MVSKIIDNFPTIKRVEVLQSVSQWRLAQTFLSHYYSGNKDLHNDNESDRGEEVCSLNLSAFVMRISSARNFAFSFCQSRSVSQQCNVVWGSKCVGMNQVISPKSDLK